MLTDGKIVESPAINGVRLKLWRRPLPMAVSLVIALMLPAEVYSAGWQAEWEKAVAAARKEGKLTAEVSSDFVRNYRPLVEHFQRKFGVEMTFQGGGRGAAAANRVIAEAGAGLYNVDYFGQGDHLGGIAGPEFLRRLVLETKLTMVADRETALDWLITGKKGIMFLIGDLATPIREAKKFGAPVDRLTKDLQEGAVIAGGGGGVMLQAPKKATHPNAGSIHQLDTVQRGPAHVAACESGQRFAARRYS